MTEQANDVEGGFVYICLGTWVLHEPWWWRNGHIMKLFHPRLAVNTSFTNSFCIPKPRYSDMTSSSCLYLGTIWNDQSSHSNSNSRVESGGLFGFSSELGWASPINSTPRTPTLSTPINSNSCLHFHVRFGSLMPSGPIWETRKHWTMDPSTPWSTPSSVLCNSNELQLV